MPSASVSTATVVKPGFFSNWRKANLRSFMVEGGNIEHRTLNIERRRSGRRFGRTFDVGRSMLDVRRNSKYPLNTSRLLFGKRMSQKLATKWRHMVEPHWILSLLPSECFV